MSVSPLIQQYNELVQQHPKSVILLRVGDFYETYGEIAVITSKILGITLTKRNNNDHQSIELSGFPYHSLDTYLPKLINAGYSVAVCDQLEDPSKAKGLVKRGITEFVTPGIVINDNVLANNKNNYLASLFINKNNIAISLLDISTGEFLTSQSGKDDIDKIIYNFKPSEIIFSQDQREQIFQFLSN